jgi:hypothetical protein
MSKPKTIAFSELRLLPNQGGAFVPMSMPPRQRHWWRCEPQLGAARERAEGERFAKASPSTAQAPRNLAVQSQWAASLASAPLEELGSNEDQAAMPFMAEPAQSPVRLADRSEARHRGRMPLELAPADLPPPVAAAARSISQANALLEVCALVVELCGDERERVVGTWEATLPLARQGLEGTLLWLSLSRASLALRFVCDEPRTVDMLRPRVAELRRQLLGRLNAPLELSIDVEMS